MPPASRAPGETASGGPGAERVTRRPAHAADGGAALWDFLTTFVGARRAFRRVRRRYEKRVLAAAAKRNVARENLLLPPALLWRLFELERLEALRDQYLEPLRRQAHAIFGERGDEGLMDAFCGHVYHEFAILCEEHRSVGRFVTLHDPERYRELFQEVSGYYPTRLRRIRRFLEKGMDRLEELLPSWGRHRVVVRSAYLFGEALARSAWREGLEGLYARMYPKDRAAEGFLEAARSFHAAGFDEQAREASARALAAARSQAAAPDAAPAQSPSGLRPGGPGLLHEVEAFQRALEGAATLPPRAPVRTIVGVSPPRPDPAPAPTATSGVTAGRRVWMTSFGCQMNVLDAELVQGDLGRRGWAKAETMESADVVLIQTCSVREHAEDKVWSLLGRARLLKEERPGLLIGVLGCMAQRAKDQIVKRAPHVDLVLGTTSFRTAVDDLEDLAERGGRILRTPLVPPPERLPDADRDVTARPDAFRAFVTVMRGCDHVCAYCIVPFTRGREVSRPLAEVVGEVRRLADDGVREVTFLGQNINTYGKDADEGGLCALLEQSARVPGIDRLRFLTSNPFDMTEDMMRRIGAVPAVMPWLHIPAQSGHDAVLKRMKRTYTVARYEEVVGWARAHVPGVEITSDFIVGFPGETEEEFQASVALVERIGFLQTYVFKYSVRPRTLSARRLPDDVPEEEKKRRNALLLAAQDRTSRLRQAALVGRDVEILVEGESKTDARRVTGRDRYNRLVHCDGDADALAGRLLTVRITEASAHCLVGRPAPTAALR